MRPSLTLSPVDVLVLFQPALDWDGMPLWWRVAKRWLRPGYGHVMCLFYDPDGDAFCVINPTLSGMQARAFSARTLSVQTLLREYPATAWRLVRRDRSDGVQTVRGLVTCVSVVKSVLGLGGRSWTPWQLLQQIDSMQASAADGRLAEDAESSRAHCGGAQGQG